MGAYMLRDYLLDHFGRKLYKISIDAGFTCPNRDGKCGFGGCIFCSAGGSGDFAEKITSDIETWIEKGKKRVEAKFHPSVEGANYIAYFQAFTNTYAPVPVLREKFEAAINHPDIAVLSIATRPDCLGEDVVELLGELNQKKPVWVELGLQTANDETAEFLNRGYGTWVYDDAVRRLDDAGIKQITHVIFGLPGETEGDMLETVKHVVRAGSWGIKLQMLHILKNTRLAEIYEQDPFPVLSMEEYIDIVVKAVEILPEGMVIHRLTGDGPKRILMQPEWSTDKKRVLNALQKALSALKTSAVD